MRKTQILTFCCLLTHTRTLLQLRSASLDDVHSCICNSTTTTNAHTHPHRMIHSLYSFDEIYHYLLFFISLAYSRKSFLFNVASPKPKCLYNNTLLAQFSTPLINGICILGTVLLEYNCLSVFCCPPL